MKAGVSSSAHLPVQIESLVSFLSHFPETQEVTHEYVQRAEYWTGINKTLREEVEKGNIDWQKYDEIIGQLVAAKEWLADHDLLTGLSNRRAFVEALDNKLKESSLYKIPLTMASLDFDNFKQVNDNLGHQEGNNLLIAIGNILKNNMKPGWVAARVGGDEIAIIMTHATLEEAEGHTQALDLKMAESIKANDKLAALPKPFGVSFGIAQWDGIESAESLESRADSRMYSAKENSKNG